MSSPIPLPARPNGPTLRKMLSTEHFAALAALYPAALAAVAERLEVAKDLTAARVVIEAVNPKGRLIDFGGDVSPANVERMLAHGQITPAEAASVAGALQAVRSIETLETLATRIEALEAALKAAA